MSSWATLNKAYRDEDNILDQIYKSKYVWNIITIVIILYSIKRKCILTINKIANTTVALKPNLMSSLCYARLYNLGVMSCISLFMHYLSSVLKFKNLYNKDPRRFAFNIFGLHSYMPW